MKLFTIGLAGILLIACGVGFSADDQNGWRCFDTAHDPLVERELFVGCIVEKTRRDMGRNPQLYGPIVVKPDQIDIEFIKVDQDEGGERWVTYHFRYPTKDGSWCRYYIPDQFGRYYVQGSYPETTQPNGRC